MKKFVPYLIGGVALIVLLAIVLYAPLRNARTFDQRITLRQHDKIPYGTQVAERLLHASFSKAHVWYDKAAPGYWENLDEDSSNQAVFLISKNFNPEREELKSLSKFIRHGNYVFLITQHLNEAAAQFFNIENDQFFAVAAEDSLQLSLQTTPVAPPTYFYPGRRFDNYFSSIDSATAVPLGYNSNGQPNFIQLQSGSGKLFIHLAPLAFSNYFLLHKNNVRYFQNVLSLIPDGVDKIVWNEYYLAQHGPKEREPNILRVLWRHSAFRYGLMTVVATLLLYVLSAMRRRQRLIPVYQKPANDSLDFVRTIGRLYYDRRDHHNLAKKMAAFFLEHVRNRYHIVTQTPDETFVDELHNKSGFNNEELKKIVDFIQYLDTYTFITEPELIRFYQQLHHFYKNTNGIFV